MRIQKAGDTYLNEVGSPVRTYQRSFEYRDISDGKLKAVDDLMLEIDAHQFVNETSARRIGFVDGHHRQYDASNDNSQEPVSEYHPRMKGDHEYRTDTRFERDEDGKYTLRAVEPTKEDEKPKIIRTPEDRASGRDFSATKKAKAERLSSRIRKKIEKRQSIGDPNCVQSRDEDFPLLAVLRRDKRADLIAAVLQYRQLVALCESEPLKGQSYGDGSANGVNIVYRSKTTDDGEIEYRSEVKKSQGSYSIPPRRILAAQVSDDGTVHGGRTESLHIKLNEDALADYIDKKPVLARIRSVLGALLDPVEDAVLGGQTMESIGKSNGQSGREAKSAGKALVYRGLTVLDSFLGYVHPSQSNDNLLREKRKLA
ncbi:hypothetical protein CN878_02720 [Ochrobactrum sp. 695/2009]|nr:hypothetical protein [Brucella intermedia]PJR89967.1 hypothetical protein CN881_12295 [Ochrobactrum sp. 721/2009]PJT14184.1 hypothetical protein CN880_21325 [Ochrobactrum sp. 720/2009]PJT24353.1 hypothetical protein CN879_08355 [Ochrobactrum sp. 715/2009]PJT30322.1 hypothetical protein CN878_02720 [Ochrobactrum sp. 695/2009]PJT33849.1 hypothetical protein CN877_09615 [Ochrobactrum sp. 689/2009]